MNTYNMKNLFLINEDEKNRILNLHESATKRHYLSEQQTTGYIIQLTESDLKKTINKVLLREDVETLPDMKNVPSKENVSKIPSNYLLFDGTKLSWYVNGKVVKSWKAVSGRTKFNTFGDKNSEKLVKKYGGKNTEFMKIKKQGPIPVGDYTISQLQKRTNGNATSFIQGKTDKELYNIMINDKGHDWNTGTKTDFIAWGDYRLPITKFGETETFGRGSFYIHGGGIPGSIGCIDLLNQMNDFVEYFEDWKNKSNNKTLKLVVKY